MNDMIHGGSNQAYGFVILLILTVTRYQASDVTYGDSDQALS
jgi:hypothetical protein